MPFYKVPLRPSDDGDYMFDFVIIEETTGIAAYETACAILPTVFGDAEEDERYNLAEIVAVADPLLEPWPILTAAYVERVEALLVEHRIDSAIRKKVLEQIKQDLKK